MMARSVVRILVAGAALVLMLAVLLAIPEDLRSTSHGSADAACPPIVGYAHVALRTNDFAAAKRFYGQILGFDEVQGLTGRGSGTLIFKVNDHQYIEVSRGQGNPREDLLIRIAFETTNARALRHYLALQDVTALGEARRTPEGDLGFTVQDPEGHPIEFVQYMPGSAERRDFGKEAPDTRISTRLIHAGFIVKSRVVEDRFFANALGFHLMWYGGMTDQRTDWVDMRVRDGSNWLEYMLNARDSSPHTLGLLCHFSLGVPSVAQAYKTVVKRGYRPHKPQIGRDGKWQLNLYDPDGTRVEMMEPKPVRTPCCSPMLLAGAAE